MDDSGNPGSLPVPFIAPDCSTIVGGKDCAASITSTIRDFNMNDEDFQSLNGDAEMNKSMQLYIDELQETLIVYRANEQKLSQTNIQLAKENDDLKANVERLEKEVAEANLKIFDHENSECLTRNGGMVSTPENDNNKLEISRLNKKLEAQKDTLIAVNNKYNEAHKEVSQWKKVINEQNRKCDKLLNTIKIHETRMAKDNETILNLKKELEAKMNDSVAMQGSYKEATKLVAQLSKEVKTLKNQQNESSDTFNTLKIQAKEINILSNENESLRRELHKERSITVQKMKSIEDLNKTISSLKSSAKTSEDKDHWRRKEIDLLRDRIKINRSFSPDHESKLENENTIKNLKSQIDKYVQEIGLLKAQNNFLRKDDMYDNDKTSLVLENQKLQKELERQKVYETNARENIEMLVSEHGERLRNIEIQHKQELAELMDEIESQKCKSILEKQDIEEKLSSSQKAMEEVLKNIEQLGNDYLDLETEKKDIQKNSEEEIRISRNYVKELEEKLDIKTEENIAIQEKMFKNNTNCNGQGCCEECQNVINALKQRIREIILEMTNGYECSEKTIRKLENEINKLKETISTSDKKIENNEDNEKSETCRCQDSRRVKQLILEIEEQSKMHDQRSSELMIKIKQLKTFNALNLPHFDAQEDRSRLISPAFQLHPVTNLILSFYEQKPLAIMDQTQNTNVQKFDLVHMFHMFNLFLKDYGKNN